MDSPVKKLEDSQYSQTKEYKAPRGKHIHISLNLIIAILALWYIILVGTSLIEQRLVSIIESTHTKNHITNKNDKVRAKTIKKIKKRVQNENE